jgi:hypothetical protein
MVAAGGRFERSARFWLRAYPRRWRAARGEELLAVLADLASADATRVGARTAVNLVRGGWAARWRGHPPWFGWLGYRLLNAQLPREYRDWVVDDIEGLLFPVRKGPVSFLIPIYLLMGVQGLSSPSNGLDPFFGFGAAGLVVVLSFVLRRRDRNFARKQHLVAEPGDPLVPGIYVAMGAPRTRVPARWAAPRAVAVRVLIAVATVPAVVMAPTRFVSRPTPGATGSWDIIVGPVGLPGRVIAVGVVLGGALVGVRLALRARHRLAAGLPRLVPQPDRVVRAPGVVADLGFAALVGVIGLEAWAEATGQIPLAFTPVIAAMALWHLPRTVVSVRAGAALGWSTPEAGELAWADLAWASWATKPPRVDQPVSVVRRWDGPLVPGQVVLGPRLPDDPSGPPVIA